MEFHQRRTPVRLVTIRRADRAADGGPIVVGPTGAAAVLRELVGARDREHFVCLHLDTRNRIFAAEVVSIGTLNQTVVHPREIFKAAIVNGAAAIIVGHNHPSGNVEPSREDDAIDKRLTEAGALLGIPLLDFLIVSEKGHWSRRERRI